MLQPGSNNTVRIWSNQGMSGISFSRFQNPVPEPGTWAMILLGFGAAGFAMRRARTQKGRLLTA